MDKPLSVYYFGSKNKNMQMLREKTSSGAFVVNDIAMHFMNPNIPFGGVGASGYGRCHGFEGFKECSNMKSIMRKW